MIGYLTKSEAGLSQLLRSVNEQAGDMTNMELLNLLASVLDKHREVSIQETIYRILSLPMTKSSVVVKFLSTIHPHFRDGLLKSDIESLEDGDSIFHNSPHKYYESRELECIDGITYEDDECEPDYWIKLTLSEFWSDYDIVYGQKSSENKKHIPLKNGTGYIKRRHERCILRYYLNYDNEEDLKRGLLILFSPFVNEMEDIHEKDIDELYSEFEEIIQKKRNIFEKHKVMTEIIESIQKEIEDKSVDTDENENEEFIDEETTSKDELADFEIWAKDQAKKSLMKHKDLTTIVEVEDIRKLIMKLNEQQRRILDDSCERLLDGESSPFYLYIAGEAGTGKFFLLKVMIEVIKQLKLAPGDDLRKPPALVLAPTANAAYIIGGKTIESSLGMLPRNSNTFSKRKKDRISSLTFLYEDVSVVFCDEISMVGSSKFTRVNFQLQDIKGSNDFMGGLSFIAVGDFRQLPPVRDSYVYEKNHLDGRPSLSPSHWDYNFKL